MKTKKGLKKYLHQLDMIYGGFDNFRVLYIQSLIDRKQLDIPIDEHNNFDDIFIKNFDLNCENFVDSSYNTIYEDIRTLFKFDDECIMGEIYDSEQIKEAISKLDNRRQQIIRQRYGLDNTNEVKYSEIAEKYSITIERARQLKEKSIMQLQMNTVYGRRLIVNRDEEKRRQFIIKYFENHDIFLDNEEIITEEEREELLGIIGYKGHIEENRGELPKETMHKDDEPVLVEKNDNEPSEIEQENDNEPVILIEELGLNARLYNILKRAGIKTTKDLENTSLRQFSKMRNMGEKTLQELLTNMDSLGIKPKDEELESQEGKPHKVMQSNESNIISIKELWLSARLDNILNRAGIKTTKDLENISLRQFSEMRNMGEKALEELMIKMHSLGIKTKDEEEISSTEIDSPEQKRKPIEALGISTRLYNALDRAKIATIGDLSNTTVDEFKKMRYMGEKTFDELMTKMDSLGIKPKPVEDTDEELLRTIQKLSRAYDENKKKGVECQELKQSIFELLDKIDKDSAKNKENGDITESGNDSHGNIDK